MNALIPFAILAFSLFSCKETGNVDALQNVSLADVDTGKEMIRPSLQNIEIEDSTAFHRALAVIEGRVVSLGEGSKFLWPTISVSRVLKNESRYKFDSTVVVGHYSWSAGLEVGLNCQFYLVPFPPGSNILKDERWVLLDGETSIGARCVDI